MSKRKPIYTEIMVIVHGKSELSICSYIKSNLKIKMEIISEKNGRNSIQINGLLNVLNNVHLKNPDNFFREYTDVETISKKELANFKLFTIMDTDDCTFSDAESYKNKSMFKKHWLYDHIIPIYNTENLEDVLKQAKIPFQTKQKGKYIDIFPVNRDQTDIKQIQDFHMKISYASNISNLNVFIEECLKVQEKYTHM